MPDSSEAGSTVDVTAAAREGEGHWSLDPAKSSVEFHVKHFWGLITVHGRFERFEGDGTVGPDGAISGRLVIDAASLTTKNRKRDEHLRSADFFDVEHHPKVVVTAHDVVPTGPTALRGRVTLEAAGHEQELDATMPVLEAGPGAVTLRCELVVDRTAHAMTWNPLGMTSRHAQAVVTAHFVRS
ncbi:MAG TPA: YceI family protein [Mycobacteriales bacterium]|jgi:polyisoprenoid-binding protein YceI|nr:YceI family protein [Mycobacteriales bacterium]